VPAENVAITIILDAIIESSVSTESGFISGICSASDVPSATLAIKTAKIESKQKPRGFTQSFSFRLYKRKRSLSTVIGASTTHSLYFHFISYATVAAND
tara:strand:- start:484 stop:780 length:297 start_codon:yes stop_codon:yes gene_type:complete